jgi:hypothetical protein
LEITKLEAGQNLRDFQKQEDINQGREGRRRVEWKRGKRKSGQKTRGRHKVCGIKVSKSLTARSPLLFFFIITCTAV